MKDIYKFSRKIFRRNLLQGVIMFLILLAFILFPFEGVNTYMVIATLILFIVFSCVYFYDSYKAEIILEDDYIVRKGLIERRARYEDITSIKFAHPRIYISTEGRLTYFLQVGGVKRREELVRKIADRMPESATIKGYSADKEDLLGSGES